MNYRVILAGLALVAVPFASASAMPVSTFLTKADALQKKGAMAVLSKDLRLLMNQIKQDAGDLKTANQAAVAAGKPKAYCTPAGGVKLSNRDILEAMRAVPPAQRAATSTRDALRTYFAKRWPC